MLKSPSGVALHIESGRHNVSRRRHSSGDEHCSNHLRQTNYRLEYPPAVRTYIAFEASFNGSGYECYLCHKLFRTLSGLNSYLNSPHMMARNLGVRV